MSSSGTDTRRKSLQLDHTLQELESALGEWEKSTDNGAAADSSVTAAAKPPPGPSVDPEVRKRTKELLAKLRTQLAELSND